MTKEQLLNKHLDVDEVLSRDSPNNMALCNKMTEISIEYAISVLEELNSYWNDQLTDYEDMGTFSSQLEQKIMSLKSLFKQ